VDRESRARLNPHPRLRQAGERAGIRKFKGVHLDGAKASAPPGLLRSTIFPLTTGIRIGIVWFMDLALIVTSCCRRRREMLAGRDARVSTQL
jgi:hypothetical protein